MKIIKKILEMILKTLYYLLKVIHFIVTHLTFKGINPKDYYDDEIDIKNNNWD